MFCKECKWYRERILGLSNEHPWCEHPVHLNSTTMMAYPVKYDLPACGSFEAIKATSPIQSCFLCEWYASSADLFCTEPSYANAQDILKSHINKQTGCSLFKSAASKANCGQCFWYDPTKEYCVQQAVHQIEFFIKSDTVVCDHFFEPVDPEHACGECGYFYEMSSFQAVCKNKKISKIYKKEVLADHLACKKHFKSKKTKLKRTCGQCHFFAGSENHHICVSGDIIEYVVEADLDATKCSSFAPKVKAKDGSVCYSCEWLSGSKEHCIYRGEPGSDFPKGDKCAFYKLQHMNPDDVEIVEVVLNKEKEPLKDLPCTTCKYFSEDDFLDDKGHCFRPYSSSDLKTDCVHYESKSEPKQPHTCSECEHFAVLSNKKTICGTEEVSDLYTKADQPACEWHFKPTTKKPKACKAVAKPGQRKIKWQEK